MTEAYDPLDYQNLAYSIVRALLETEPATLPPTKNFIGSGVYALYYTGPLKFYHRISSTKLRAPIYVGKAVQKGARKGNYENRTGTELYGRLRQHANSIRESRNLDPEEFQCRYLVIVPVWITLAERFLIDHFRPAWNIVIEGFGNHPPGRGRSNMRRPRWDIVHPGRPWAERLRAEETVEGIIGLLES